MSGHTPGPWGPHRHAHAAVISTDGMLIANCGGHANNMRDQDELIAEQEANARLIAAAPDLLESLQALDSLWSESEAQAVDFTHAVAQARAAIAKATGSQP